MIALSFTQLISGSGFAYLNEVVANRSYVPPSWLGCIGSFLASCKESMIIPDAWTLKIQRRHDAIMMDVFTASHPGNATLDKLNR
eukprot:9285653-Ditylum_brightwellii.AAC.1